MSIKYDNDPDVAIGITLPITNGKEGYFNRSYTTLEQAKSNLKNLLLTMKGERPMQPDFGSDLMKMVFEQDDGTLVDRIRNTIINAVTTWLPYLTINTIEVNNQISGDDNNINRYNINLVFSLVNDKDMLDSLTINLDMANI